MALGALLGAAREMKDKGTFTFVETAASGPEVSGFMAPRKDRAGAA